MIWEPKQNEMVFYKINGGPLRGTGLFVCMYQGKHLLDDEGDFILVSSIERLVIEKEPEITVGSVWEWDKKLWVVTHISKDDLNVSFWCPDSSEYYPCALIKNFKPRPDKIGVAPCLRRVEVKPDGSRSSSYEWLISDQVFRCKEDAGIYCDSEKFIWPANNSMWVIVNKE